jgi:hypothetical protein
LQCGCSGDKHKRGNYGKLKVWYIPNRITNIFMMHELEKHYWITYTNWLGYYVCVCELDLQSG